MQHRALAVLLCLCFISTGCPSTVEYVAADPSDEVSAEPPPSGEVLTLNPYMASEPLKLYYSDTDPSSQLLYPALRFDLSPVPGDATIRSATLRLRRSVITWGGDDEPPDDLLIEVINVNSGLRVYEIHSIREVLTIERAARTEDESEVWVEIENDIGPSIPTIELANAIYRERAYADLLSRWNENVTQEMTTSGAWDELDVTDLVRSEVGGDRSLTLLIRAPEDEVTLEWYGLDDIDVEDGQDSSRLRPRLVIEYDFGDEDSPPAETVVEVESDQEIGVTPVETLPTLARTAVIFSSEPSGARIYIDDDFVGTTIEGETVEIPLTEETVSVRLVAHGYLPWEETLRLFPGAEQRVHAVLEPAPPTFPPN